MRFIAAAAFSALTLAACGGAQASATASTSATASITPSPVATATPTPTPTPAPTGPVVLAQSVGNMGVLLVAASNGHTLYTFDSDSPGVSRCAGSCASIWPPLALMAGETLTGGAGVTAGLGTIHRSDGTLQVTYKGLPLYFFHNDTAPGETFGDYTGWSLVHP